MGKLVAKWERHEGSAQRASVREGLMIPAGDVVDFSGYCSSSKFGFIVSL